MHFAHEATTEHNRAMAEEYDFMSHYYAEIAIPRMTLQNLIEYHKILTEYTDAMIECSEAIFYYNEALLEYNMEVIERTGAAVHHSAAVIDDNEDMIEYYEYLIEQNETTIELVEAMIEYREYESYRKEQDDSMTGASTEPALPMSDTAHPQESAPHDEPGTTGQPPQEEHGTTGQPPQDEHGTTDQPPQDEQGTTEQPPQSNRSTSSSSTTSTTAPQRTFEPPEAISRLTTRPKAIRTRCLCKYWSELAEISSPVDDYAPPGSAVPELEAILAGQERPAPLYAPTEPQEPQEDLPPANSYRNREERPSPAIQRDNGEGVEDSRSVHQALCNVHKELWSLSAVVGGADLADRLMLEHELEVARRTELRNLRLRVRDEKLSCSRNDLSC